MPEAPLLHLTDVVKHFPLGGGVFAKPTAWVKAVCGVSFTVQRGESFGLVGESGCGKTTIGRMILRLIEPTGGRIEFDGQDLTALRRKDMGRLRRRMQIIFQDPYSSLDPRMTVEQIITEPLRTVHVYPAPSGVKRPRPSWTRSVCAGRIWTNTPMNFPAASASASASPAPCASGRS